MATLLINKENSLIWANQKLQKCFKVYTLVALAFRFIKNCKLIDISIGHIAAQ